MNRTLKEATVKRCHSDAHDRIKTRLSDLIDAYNYARWLKTSNGLTRIEDICKIWTYKPERFKVYPIHHMLEINSIG